MRDILVRNWWAIALRGLFAVLFGIAAFVWPGLTLAVLVILWGAYALADGIFNLVAAFRAAQQRFDEDPATYRRLAEEHTGDGDRTVRRAARRLLARV